MTGQPVPFRLVDDLAVYRVGAGAPLLWMPYPHAAEVVGDPGPDALVELLRGLGRRVITFDPPRSGRSARPMRLGMPEMLRCAEEALNAGGARPPVDVVGHSQGAIAALAFALERPSWVRRLVLIGGAAGGPSYFGAPGFIGNRHHARFRRMALAGIAYLLTRRRATEKIMCNVMFRASFVDPRRFAPERVSLRDWLRPARPRTRWAGLARHLDYRHRLGEVRAPTLILVGRHDPQCPLACSQELAAGIPDTTLRIFERSGHSPFIEEPAAVRDALHGFLRIEDPSGVQRSNMAPFGSDRS